MNDLILKYESSESERIDKYLQSLNLENLYSRNLIDLLIAQGDVLVNDKICKKSHKLKNGDQIQLKLPEPQSAAVLPEDIPLNILYEDEYLAIIDKPAGMTIHPAPGNRTGTLVNALLQRYEEIAELDSERPGIVHRLDKDTSGLVLIAKTKKVHFLLTELFRNREIKKYYKAILVGHLKETEGTIENYIERSHKDRKKMIVSSTGRLSVTHYKVEKNYGCFSFVDIELETGRTHQIRVHFSHLGCPVLGDTTYNNLDRTLSQIPANLQRKIKLLLTNKLKRQALHSYKLVFKHPVLESTICVESPLPDDIAYSLDFIKQNFSLE